MSKCFLPSPGWTVVRWLISCSFQRFWARVANWILYRSFVGFFSFAVSLLLSFTSAPWDHFPSKLFPSFCFQHPDGDTSHPRDRKIEAHKNENIYRRSHTVLKPSLETIGPDTLSVLLPPHHNFCPHYGLAQFINAIYVQAVLVIIRDC